MESSGPGFVLTMILLAAGFGVTAFAGWRSSLPANPAKGPRMIPWMMIVLAGAVWILVMLVHLANLIGLETGQRWGF